MLGLGDVVFPGLLLTLALRVDYALCRKRGGTRYKANAFVGFFQRKLCMDIQGGYFPWICLGYATGLMVTFMANIFRWTINGVPGQPALIYLVPFTVCTFRFIAWRRGELKELLGSSWSAEFDANLDSSSSYDTGTVAELRPAEETKGTEGALEDNGTSPLLASSDISENTKML